MNVPAFIRNHFPLSHIWSIAVLIFGILYLGNSSRNEDGSPLNRNFLSISAIITASTIPRIYIENTAAPAAYPDPNMTPAIRA